MLPDSVRNVLDRPRPSGITLRRQVAVFGLYLVIAILYTWPLAFNLTTHIPDKHPTLTLESDAVLQTWYPWWVRKALLDPDETVLHTDWVYYPVGMEMTMQPAMFLHGAMTIPLFWLDITAADNVVIIVSFALSGLAAFLLGMYVTRSIPASLFCGFIYAFCPYKLQHLEGHIQLMATETLPLVALSLIRLFDKPTRRHLIWSGIWLGITVYTDYYYFAYALLMFGFLVLYRLITDRDRVGVLRNTVLSGLIAFAVAGPLLVPALVSASQSDYALATGHDKHKADLLSPLVPSQRQWLTRPLMPFLSQYIDMHHVDGIEHSLYVGWPLLILCMVYGRRVGSGRNPRVFILITGVFFLLALGPSLRVNGHDLFETWTVYLPGWVLKEAPVYRGARAPSRIFIIAAIGLAVWGACALRRLLASGTVLRVRSEYVAAGVVAFTGLEYIIPTGMSELRRPAWTEVVAADDDPGILVRVPMVPTVPAFWQTITDRKELKASLGRADQDLAYYYWRHEALQFLTMPHYATWMPSQNDARFLVDLLNIRYVVLDLDAYDVRRLEQAKTVLTQAYGLEEVYRDSSSALFRMPGTHRALRGMQFRASDDPSELYLPFGWSNRKPYETDIITWILRERAVIALPAIQPGDYTIHLDLRVLAERDFGIRAEINGEEVGTYTVGPGQHRVSIDADQDLLNQTETNLITLRPNIDTGFPHNAGWSLVSPGDLPPIEVKSGGFFTEKVGYAEIRVGGKAISTMRRGILVAVIDTTGEIEVEQFESLNSETTVDDLENYLKSAPETSTIAIAVRTISYLYGGKIGQALRWVGLPESLQLNALDSFALLGGKDGRLPLLDTGAGPARIGTRNSQRSAEGAVGLLGMELVQR